MPSANVRSLHFIRPMSLSPCFRKTTLRHLGREAELWLHTDLASVLPLSGDMPAAEDQNRCGRATCHQDPTPVQLFVPELKELELSFVEFSAAPSGTAERSLPAKSTFLDLP